MNNPSNIRLKVNLKRKKKVKNLFGLSVSVFARSLSLLETFGAKKKKWFKLCFVLETHFPCLSLSTFSIPRKRQKDKKTKMVQIIYILETF
jgi:hypothetical protein